MTSPRFHPVPDAPDHIDVEFTCEDTGERVVLFSALTDRTDLDAFELRPDPARPGVRSLTLRLPEDLRVTYRFAVGTALHALGHDDWPAFAETLRPDPANPAQLVFSAEGDEEPLRMSILELPGAPAQPWLVPDPSVPKGDLVEESPFGRPVWLYSPHQSTRPAGEKPPLVVFFDGDAYTGLIPGPVILDNLIAAGLIPPVAALFIHSGYDQETRTSELGCSPDYLRHLVEEMLPWVAGRMPVQERGHVAAGSSLGGLFAAYCAVSRPDLFGGVLSQSGAFGWPTDEVSSGGMVDRVAEGDASVRWYLDIGLLEDKPFHLPEAPLTTNRRMRDALEAKGCAFTYAEYNGGHDYASWRGSVADGLIALLGGK